MSGLRRILLRAGMRSTRIVMACAPFAAADLCAPSRFHARADALQKPPPAAAVDAVARAGEGAAADAAAGPSLLDALIGSNQFTQGGVTLMVVGACLAAAHSLLLQGLEVCRRKVVVSAEIDSRDDAYRWLMYWLAQQPSFRDSRCVSVHTSLGTTFGTSVPASAPQASADALPTVTFLPAPGWHLLRHQGRWFAVARRRATGNPQLAANARLLMETLHLATLGTSRQPLEQLLTEAAASYRSSQRQRTGVWSVDQDGYWQQVGSRPVRPLSSVVLPEGRAEAILSDCREFLESEEWYSHHGIPWRRGYLLYGPPGSGKTSLVMGLAGALQLDIYVTTLSSPAMSDEILRGLLNQAGTRALLLLEDVDAAFTETRAVAEGGGGNRLTFSGLLNALDGVAAQEGRLVFMTTNHIERLNEALIRPGRVDVRCKFDDATEEQIEQLFYSFYSDLPPAIAAKAAAAGPKAQPAEGGASGPAARPPRALESFDGGFDDSGPVGEAAEPAAAAAAASGAGLAAPQPADKAAAAPGKPGPSSSSAAAAAAVAPGGLEPAELRRMAHDFCASLGGAPGASMAALQGYLMRHKRDPRGALAGAGTLAAELRARGGA